MVLSKLCLLRLLCLQFPLSCFLDHVQLQLTAVWAFMVAAAIDSVAIIIRIGLLRHSDIDPSKIVTATVDLGQALQIQASLPFVGSLASTFTTSSWQSGDPFAFLCLTSSTFTAGSRHSS